MKDGAGLNATVKDIAENPHNVEIVELEAAQVARVTGETAYVKQTARMQTARTKQKMMLQKRMQKQRKQQKTLNNNG